jgi:hypothetical protein
VLVGRMQIERDLWEQFLVEMEALRIPVHPAFN